MYLQINDLNIYFQKTGRGKVLIMLHGWGQDVSTFWGIIEFLKDKYTVYLLDLPGFGKSDSPKNPLTTLDYAKIVKEFMSKQKINKPIILGHSFGGRIAIKLSSIYPKVIDKLILEDSAGIRSKMSFFRIIVYIPVKIFHYLIPNIFNLKDKTRYKFYKKLGLDYINAGILIDTFKNILNEDLSDDLRKIDVETLLIWGEKDSTGEASLKNGKKMYQLINNSRIEVFEGVGHFPHLEKPEKFAYYVKNFS